MTKSVRDRLLEQAKKFHKWQETTYPGITTAEIGGEWKSIIQTGMTLTMHFVMCSIKWIQKQRRHPIE